MCKPWPGLRCTTHPHQRIQQLSLTIHEREKELSKIDDDLNNLANKYGETVEEQDEYVSLRETRETLLAKIQVSNEKRDEEILHYMMSAGGRKELQATIDNPVSTNTEKLEAAANLAAVENRIGIQKEISQVLRDDDIPSNEKDAYLELQYDFQNKKIKTLLAEKDLVLAEKTRLENLLNNPSLTPEQHTQISEALAKETSKFIYLDKEIKQRESLNREIKRFKEQYRRKWEQNWDKHFGRFMKIVDFLLQPNKRAFV